MHDEDRQSFFTRLEPVLSPRELLLVDLAYQLAKFNHRWQCRQQMDDSGDVVRYFEHLRGTALVLIDEVGCIKTDLVITALLHDSLEDTRDLTAAKLECWFQKFGPNVARRVKLLSKNPKAGYVERLGCHADWGTLLIKACDNVNNLRSLERLPRDFQIKQGNKAYDHYLPLFERLVAITPSSQAGVRSVIEDIKRLATHYKNLPRTLTGDSDGFYDPVGRTPKDED
ncbi:HD domain-containing protein [Patescibacteria group bacterium]|nr:HD domain-containing protein [Patescibacteria group bacterium]